MALLSTFGPGDDSQHSGPMDFIRTTLVKAAERQHEQQTPPPPAITRQEIVRFCMRMEAGILPHMLELGQMIDSHLRQQPDRKLAMAAIRADLRAENVLTDPAYALASFWVVKLFHGEAAKVRAGCIRAMVRLIRRRPNHDWEVRPKFQVQARALWDEIVACKLSGKTTLERVAKIRPQRKVRARSKNSQHLRIFRQVAHLTTPEACEEVINLAKARLEKLRPAEQSKDAAA